MWETNVDIVKYVLFDVPRDTFYFHDNYYHRDHHQEWSFRHDMRIPDDILPDAWRREHSSPLSGSISSEHEEGDDEDDDHESESRTMDEASATWNASDGNDLHTLLVQGKKRGNKNDKGAARHNDL